MRDLTDSDPILWAIMMYKNHPSILKIKDFDLTRTECFSFKPTNFESVVQEMFALNPSKSPLPLPPPHRIHPPKALNRHIKTNYRPVSTLPALPKITERLMYNQIEKYMEGILSMYQCGFRKGMSAKTAYFLWLKSGEFA